MDASTDSPGSLSNRFRLEEEALTSSSEAISGFLLLSPADCLDFFFRGSSSSFVLSGEFDSSGNPNSCAINCWNSSFTKAHKGALDFNFERPLRAFSMRALKVRTSSDSFQNQPINVGNEAFLPPNDGASSASTLA